MNKSLEELGLRKNRVIETIFLTRGENEVNHAPIGIRRKNDRELVSKVYKENQTYENLIRNKKFSINLTKDPGAFYKSVFNKKLETINFELKRSFAVIKGKWTDLIQKEDFGLFRLKPIEIKRKKPNKRRGYCRAETALIEALIYYTKIPFEDKKNCLKRIAYLEEIIEKTGSDKEKKLIKKIKKKANSKT